MCVGVALSGFFEGTRGGGGGGGENGGGESVINGIRYMTCLLKYGVVVGKSKKAMIKH